MISTIIFDFGDVFINLDKQAATQNIISRFGPFDFSKKLLDINEQYEMGKISTDRLVSFYQDYFKTSDILFLKKAWNSIILDFPEYRLDFIKELSNLKKYRLILLSNTNELHIEQVKENMTNERYSSFKTCFDKFYLSHEIGFRKPNSDIFEFVLKQNNLKAEECVFIDDTKEHTVTAQSLGINVWHLDPKSDDVTNLFTKKAHLFESN